MIYDHIIVQHMADLQLRIGEKVVGAVHARSGPVVLVFTDTGRVISFQYDRH